MDVDEVDVGGEVQLPAAELAERHDAEVETSGGRADGALDVPLRRTEAGLDPGECECEGMAEQRVREVRELREGLAAALGGNQIRAPARWSRRMRRLSNHCVIQLPAQKRTLPGPFSSIPRTA